MVTLTVIDEEDIELMAKFGIAVMQKGRLARIIEEAYYQEAILDGPRLLLFILESHRGIRAHLKHFWQAGVSLPVTGMSKEKRALMRELRPVLAVKRYLEGEDLTAIRKSLAISTGRWQKLFSDFKELGRDEPLSLEELAKHTGYPLEVLTVWQKLWVEQRDI